MLNLELFLFILNHQKCLRLFLVDGVRLLLLLLGRGWIDFAMVAGVFLGRLVEDG